MKLSEIKKKLILRIHQSQNDLLLEEMYRLLASEEEDTGLFEMSPEQKLSVERAREQYRKGEFLSQEQADKDIDEWLGK